MYFRVEFSCGMDIRTACNEAIATAHRLRLDIVFSFNGVEIYVMEDSDYEQVLETYFKHLEMMKVEQFAKDKSKELEENK